MSDPLFELLKQVEAIVGAALDDNRLIEEHGNLIYDLCEQCRAMDLELSDFYADEAKGEYSND